MEGRRKRGESARKQPLAVLNTVTFTQRLHEGLREIEGKMIDLLDISSIEKFVNDPDSSVAIIGPSHYWGSADTRQKKLQLEINKLYSEWFERFRLLFDRPTKDIREEIEKTDAFVRKWIEKESDWNLPATIDEAKKVFTETVETFHDLIDIRAGGGSQTEYLLVPDTNALIAEADLTRYSELVGTDVFGVVILPTVFEELDSLKVHHRDPDFREKVKAVIRRFDTLRGKKSLVTGIRIGKGITLRAEAREPQFGNTLSWLVRDNKDDRIIASVVEVLRNSPDAVVILVTADTNLRNKADLAGIPCAKPPGAGKEKRPKQKELIRVFAKGIVNLEKPSSSLLRENLLLTVHNDDSVDVSIKSLGIAFKDRRIKPMEMRILGSQPPIRITLRECTRPAIKCLFPYMEEGSVSKVSKVFVTTVHEPNKVYYGNIEELDEFIRKLQESRTAPGYMTPEQIVEYREMKKKRNESAAVQKAIRADARRWRG